jgi:hypothetical protein
MGPVPWIVNAEIYPTPLRTAAAGVATMGNWGGNALVSQLFPTLMGSAIGAGGTFFLVDLCILGSLIFVHRKVPETKGLTLEEIEDLAVGSHTKGSFYAEMCSPL